MDDDKIHLGNDGLPIIYPYSFCYSPCLKYYDKLVVIGIIMALITMVEIIVLLVFNTALPYECVRRKRSLLIF